MPYFSHFSFHNTQHHTHPSPLQRRPFPHDIKQQSVAGVHSPFNPTVTHANARLNAVSTLCESSRSVVHVLGREVRCFSHSALRQIVTLVISG